MPLSVKNPEADRLARRVAELTGESITDAVVVSLRERLHRLQTAPGVALRLSRLAAEVSSYPVLDDRPADEILGYDEHGLPK